MRPDQVRNMFVKDNPDERYQEDKVNGVIFIFLFLKIIRLSIWIWPKARPWSTGIRPVITRPCLTISSKRLRVPIFICRSKRGPRGFLWTRIVTGEMKVIIFFLIEIAYYDADATSRIDAYCLKCANNTIPNFEGGCHCPIGTFNSCLEGIERYRLNME